MTNLVRWDPFSELSTLHDRVNQLFNQTFGGTGRGMDQPLLSSNFIPPVDIYEDDHSITLQAEIPGVAEKDLDIRLENNFLTISGERKLENVEKKENFQRIERHYGRFTRSFTLPSAVDPDSVNAEFENGILKIMLAKRAEARPKQIRITPGKTTAQGVRPSKAA